MKKLFLNFWLLCVTTSIYSSPKYHNVESQSTISVEDSSESSPQNQAVAIVTKEYLMPKDRVELLNNIQMEIRNATKSIDIYAYSLLMIQIISSILKEIAQEKNISINIFLSQKFYNAQHHFFSKMKETIDILPPHILQKTAEKINKKNFVIWLCKTGTRYDKLPGPHLEFHHKKIIFDKKQGFDGSTNFSHTGMTETSDTTSFKIFNNEINFSMKSNNEAEAFGAIFENTTNHILQILNNKLNTQQEEPPLQKQSRT